MPDPGGADRNGTSAAALTKTSVNWFNDFRADTGIFDRARHSTYECAAKLKTLANLYYVQRELGESKWSVADDQEYDTAYNREENLCQNIPAEFKAIERNMLQAPLDQALRTVDLLLQAGGFSLLVLDLGSVPENMAWRIPLATWFRFRAGCERSRATLLVISQRPCARASADLTVAMEPGRMQSVAGAVAVGGTFHVRVEQQRRGSHIGTESNLLAFRKPPRADHDPSSNRVWTASASWKVSA